MPKFGNLSRSRLAQVHPKLRAVAEDAIKEIDFAIDCGYRGEAEQNLAFKNGFSKLRFPRSKHNKMPSRAFDFRPWPFRGWMAPGIEKDFERVAKVIKASAAKLGVKVVWGGDWKAFKDRPHFELAEGEK